MEFENVALNISDSSGAITLSNNNLTIVTANTANIRATHGKNSGKWYWEISLVGGNGVIAIGVVKKDFNITGTAMTGTGIEQKKVRLFIPSSVVKAPENTSYGVNLSVGDLVGVALDMKNGTLEFFVNGVSQGISHNNLLELSEVYPFYRSVNATSRTVSFNFGESSFAYEPPSGFLPYVQTPPISKLIFKNPKTNQHYSLAEKTLIPLPDASNETIANHGIEAGIEIRLDEEFDKIRYIVDGTVAKTINRPLSIKFE